MTDLVEGFIAQIVYFFLWYFAQQWWELNRALLAIAVIIESINQWILDNVGYFVQAVVYALEAPLVMMFTLAIAALGFWYLLNSIVATRKWVEPSKLITTGFLVLFFFGSPIVVIDILEDIRLELANAVQDSVIDGATGEILDTNLSGTDDILPAAIPDVFPEADGITGSFDLVAAFLLITNINEIANFEFPAAFETEFFPGGDPSSIDLTDESTRTEAMSDGWEGIKRQMTATIAIPTVIADHLLRLALTAVAIILYIGAPFAMLLAFFVYTEAFLMAYVRQYINLLIETFISVIIASLMVGLIVLAADQGIGLFVAANILALIVIGWRIKSAFKLAMSAVDLFGGASVTGGSSGRELINAITQTAGAGAGLALAAATGGSALALAGGLSASAKVSGNGDDAVTQGRTRQLKALAGYAMGKNKHLGSVIENVHEARTFARGFRSGGMQKQDQNPDTLDYLRVGKSLSGSGSSPWMTMGLSPGFRAAYDELGGRARSNGPVRDPELGDFAFEGRYQWEQANEGNDSGRYASSADEKAYQQYKDRNKRYEDRYDWEKANPDQAHPGYEAKDEQAYQQYKDRLTQFDRRREWEKANPDKDFGRWDEQHEREYQLYKEHKEQEETALPRIGQTARNGRYTNGINGGSEDGLSGEGEQLARLNSNIENLIRALTDPSAFEQPENSVNRDRRYGEDGEADEATWTSLDDKAETPPDLIYGDEIREQGDGRISMFSPEAEDEQLASDGDRRTDNSEPEQTVPTADQDGDGQPDVVIAGLDDDSANEIVQGIEAADRDDSPEQVIIAGVDGDGDGLTDTISVAESLDNQAGPTSSTTTADDDGLDETAIAAAAVSTAAATSGQDERGTPVAHDDEPKRVVIAGVDGDGDGLVDTTSVAQSLETEPDPGETQRVVIERTEDSPTSSGDGPQPVVIENSGELADTRSGSPPAPDEAQPVIVQDQGTDTPQQVEVNADDLADAIASAEPAAVSPVNVNTQPGEQVTNLTANITTDLDGRGQATVVTPSTSPTPVVPPTFTAPPAVGIVRLASARQGGDNSVQQVIVNLVGDMGGSNNAVAEAAHREVATYIGEQTADTLQQAVHQHSATNVQMAVNATVELVENYATQGATADEILYQFQSGAAAETIRTQTGVQLSDQQIAAVADSVLIPRRVVDKEEIAAAIHDALQQGYQSDSGLAAQLGTPQNFGGDTGSVRAVMESAAQMRLSREDMVEMARMVRDGLAQQVKSELTSRGYSRFNVDDFVDGLDSLPDAIQLPQSVAFAPGDSEGYKRFTKKDAR